MNKNDKDELYKLIMIAVRIVVAIIGLWFAVQVISIVAALMIAL